MSPPQGRWTMGSAPLRTRAAVGCRSGSPLGKMAFMTAPDCIFCRKLRDGEPLVASNDLAVALRDGYPVSEGHTLVVPRRHVATWFDATPEEQTATRGSIYWSCRHAAPSRVIPTGGHERA